MDTYEGVDNCFNLGMTKGKYENRHKNSDYGKANQVFAVFNSERQQFGWWVDTDLVDHTIHAWLKKQPYLTAIGQETFQFPKNCGLTLDIVKDMIHQEFFTTTPEKKKDLKLAKHQKEFVAKAQADYLEFLLFAKCRAGKSVMTLSHIVDKQFKATLVVSRYTSPMQSWKADSQEFEQFKDLVFIDINDKDYIQQIDYWYNTDKQLILWACIQSRKTLSLPIDIDLLVYDEAHVGYNSTQWNKLCEVTNCPILYVTGTAYKLVWDFTDSNRYVYSYFEEQLDKKKGQIVRPSMNVILAKYDSAQYQQIFGNDPDAMKNLFNVGEDKKFVNPALVQDFVTNRFATQRVLRPQNRLLKDSTHLYITLPSVDACHAFAEYMKGTRFAPYVVTGETGKTAVDINKHIAENPNGSCIITRTANVLGVTAKEVDTIVNCAEGSSVEFWTQFAFRGGSSDRDWTVIDFCPQRALESLRQTYVAACDSNPELSEYSFVDFVNVVEWSEQFVTLTHEQVVNALSSNLGNTITLVSGISSSLNFSNLRDLNFNTNIESAYDNKVKSVLLNDNNANGKTNKKKDNVSEKQGKTDMYSKIETIKAILERVPLVCYHILKSGQNVNSINQVIESDHYIHDTMDSEQIIRQCIEQSVVNPRSLSNRISQAVVDIETSMSNDECKTLEELSCSGKTQQHMNVELIESLFI